VGFGARLDAFADHVHACDGLGVMAALCQSGGSHGRERTACNDVFPFGCGTLECAVGEATGQQAVGAQQWPPMVDGVLGGTAARAPEERKERG
jgi:hypothetical protein